MNDQAEKLRQVIDNLKLKHIKSQPEFLFQQPKHTARVITITSGKGGVGKTNITINLAISLSEMGKRVVILDADFGLANIDVLFGIIPRYTLVDVINNKKTILEILSEGPKNTRFISGGSGVEELVSLEKPQLIKFVENISLLDKIADFVLIDTGAGLSENVMSFVMAADEILLVTTPEPTSITDAYALVKMVSNRDRTKKIKVIVNRAENINEAVDISNKLMLVADKFLNIRLDTIGYILQDDAVIKAVKQQQPFSICFPKSHAARNIKELSVKLADNNINNIKIIQDSGFKGFIYRLVSNMKA